MQSDLLFRSTFIAFLRSQQTSSKIPLHCKMAIDACQGALKGPPGHLIPGRDFSAEPDVLTRYLSPFSSPLSPLLDFIRERSHSPFKSSRLEHRSRPAGNAHISRRRRRQRRRHPAASIRATFFSRKKRRQQIMKSRRDFL